MWLPIIFENKQKFNNLASLSSSLFNWICPYKNTAEKIISEQSCFNMVIKYYSNRNFNKISTIFKSYKRSLETKINLLRCYVFSVEFWTFTETFTKRLEAFENWLQRRMLKKTMDFSNNEQRSAQNNEKRTKNHVHQTEKTRLSRTRYAKPISMFSSLITIQRKV